MGKQWINCLTRVLVFLIEENIDAETYLSSQIGIFGFLVQ